MVTRQSRAKIGRELHPDVVRSIELALAAQEPRRTVAARHGVHRKVVDRIAAGEHTSHRAGNRFQRCPNGHLTLLPCRTCAARLSQP